MEGLMPAVIVVYLVSSIIAAVIKGIASMKKDQQEQGREGQVLKPDTVRPREKVSLSTVEFGGDLGRAGECGKSAIKPGARLQTTSKAKKQAKSGSFTQQALVQEMRKAVVMSEILREPRSKRALPQR